MAKIGKAKIVDQAAGQPMVEEARTLLPLVQTVIDTLARHGRTGDSLSPAGCRSMARLLEEATGLRVAPPVPPLHAPVV